MARPTELPDDEAAVWDLLAPHALAQGTLTPVTVVAFGWLCRTVVLEGKLASAVATVAGPDHRGMMARMDAGLARFRLTPDGKPAAVAEPVADPFAAFELVQGGKK